MKKHLLIAAISLLQLPLLLFSSEMEDSLFVVKNKTPEILKLMEQIDGVRQGCFGWCPQFKSEAIASFILNIQPEICVEIGVLAGSSFFSIPLTLNYLNKGHAYAVDSWDSDDCVRYMPENDPNRICWGLELDYNKIAHEFRETLRAQRLESRCTVYHKDSVAAAEHFPDNFIDFIHWDCNHSFVGAKRELRAYLPKVKSGGYVMVSDVNWAVGSKTPIRDVIDILFFEWDLVGVIDEDNIYLLRKP